MRRVSTELCTSGMVVRLRSREFMMCSLFAAAPFAPRPLKLVVDDQSWLALAETFPDRGRDAGAVQSAHGEQLSGVAMVDKFVRQAQMQYRFDNTGFRHRFRHCT